MARAKQERGKKTLLQILRIADRTTASRNRGERNFEAENSPACVWLTRVRREAHRACARAPLRRVTVSTVRAGNVPNQDRSQARAEEEERMKKR